MDQSIIVFIPVKKNVSVLLKLIVVVKVRTDDFEKGGKWPMMILVKMAAVGYKITDDKSEFIPSIT